MEINKAMSRCFKNNTIVYVVHSAPYYFIEIDVNGLIKKYDKPLLKSKEINEAMEKTYIFLAKKL